VGRAAEYEDFMANYDTSQHPWQHQVRPYWVELELGVLGHLMVRCAEPHPDGLQVIKVDLDDDSGEGCMSWSRERVIFHIVVICFKPYMLQLKQLAGLDFGLSGLKLRNSFLV
jgi:hypothetical protein